MLKSAASLVLSLVLVAANAASAQTPDILNPPDITLTSAERAELTVGQNPESWFAGRLQGPREVVDGETLNAKLQYLFERSRAAPAETAEAERRAFATPEGRAAIRAAADRRWTVRTALSAPMASVDDRMILGRGGEIHVRVYRPVTAATGPLPVLVYYHGGGFVFSSVKAVDRMTRLMANEADAIVVSVDYRLAPEHPYPAAHDDAEDAFLWVRANAAALGGDPDMVAVGGDSAGGHLAAVTSLRQIAAGKPVPAYLLLYYPALSLGQDERSYGLFDQGYGLDRAFMEAVTDMAFPDPAGRSTVEAAPVTAPSLQGMPATLVVTAGFDPIRDQGRRFARRLEADGVSVLYLNYGGLTHSFLNWSGVIEEADGAARQTAALFGQAIRSRKAALTMTAAPRP